MKNIILTSALLIIGTMAYSQTSVMENTLMASVNSDVLIPTTTTQVKAADCVGEWVSSEGHHLTLLSNNKAVWKDEGHIFYMTWNSQTGNQDGNLKISLTGNAHCMCKSFTLAQTDNGMEIVQDQTNVHMYLSKETTATLQ